MGPLQAFNARMSEAGEAFRLVELAHESAPVGAASSSYELRRLDASGGAYIVCHRIRDLPPTVAAEIADAFLLGIRWAQRGGPNDLPV